MNQFVIVSGALSVKEPFNPIIIPSTATNQPPVIIVVALHHVDHVAIKLEAQNFTRQLWCYNFVAVDRQNPVVRGVINSNVLHRAKPDKRMLVQRNVLETRGNGYSVVSRTIIDNHHLSKRLKSAQTLKKINS